MRKPFFDLTSDANNDDGFDDISRRSVSEKLTSLQYLPQHRCNIVILLQVGASAPSHLTPSERCEP